MKQSRKHLLQLIYDHEQTENDPLEICYDGSNINCDPSILENDVRYLKDSGYVIKPTSYLHSFSLALTEKGERFVENGFQLPSESQTTNFNFGNANVSNAIIGNHVSGNEFTLNNQTPLSELQNLIQTKPAADQAALNEMLEILREIQSSEKPIDKGRLSRFYEVVKKSSDLLLPLGKFFVDVFFHP